jgi:Ion channel
MNSASVFPSLIRSPCFGLLFWLGALMLIEPSAEQMRGGVPLLAALHLGVLVLAVRVVSSTRDSMTLTWALVAPTVALNLAYLFVQHPVLSIANLAMLAIFYSHVIRCLLEYVLRDAVVTVDELFAATCIYVLIALVFACSYAVLERLAPGSFSIPPGPVEAVGARFFDLVYFSFTVLTSTGFGDIHALSRQARAIVIIEQVTGVMYVAIMIARLTGMHLARR